MELPGEGYPARRMGCNRAIFLDKNCMIKYGNPAEAMDFYHALIAEKENKKLEILQNSTGKAETISGRGGVKFAGIELLHSDNLNKIEFFGSTWLEQKIEVQR